jgi:hypothetical protein
MAGTSVSFCGRAALREKRGGDGGGPVRATPRGGRRRGGPGSVTPCGGGRRGGGGWWGLALAGVHGRRGWAPVNPTWQHMRGQGVKGGVWSGWLRLGSCHGPTPAYSAIW